MYIYIYPTGQIILNRLMNVMMTTIQDDDEEETDVAGHETHSKGRTFAPPNTMISAEPRKQFQPHRPSRDFDQ